jgi:hypothetical protein
MSSGVPKNTSGTTADNKRRLITKIFSIRTTAFTALNNGGQFLVKAVIIIETRIYNHYILYIYKTWMCTSANPWRKRNTKQGLGNEALKVGSYLLAIEGEIISTRDDPPNVGWWEAQEEGCTNIWSSDGLAFPRELHMVWLWLSLGRGAYDQLAAFATLNLRTDLEVHLLVSHLHCIRHVWPDTVTGQCSAPRKHLQQAC